jgi:hypothetical protein
MGGWHSDPGDDANPVRLPDWKAPPAPHTRRRSGGAQLVAAALFAAPRAGAALRSAAAAVERGRRGGWLASVGRAAPSSVDGSPQLDEKKTILLLDFTVSHVRIYYHGEGAFLHGTAL